MAKTIGFVECETMEKGATKAYPKPTEAELAILQVLWDRGPSTVREVMEAQQGRLGGGPIYTTVLKLLQIMTEKGLVKRNEEARTHIYEASTPAETTRGQLVSDLLDRAFGGSARKLVMHALSAKRASREELAEIRQLLDQLDKEDGA